MISARSRLRCPLSGFLLGALSAALIVTSFTGASLILLSTSMSVGEAFPGVARSSPIPLELRPGTDNFASRPALLG
jgi:hypothetical protein